MTDDTRGLYTVADVAERLTGSRYDYSGETNRLIRNGELTVIKIGRRRYIEPAEAERVLVARAGVKTDIWYWQLRSGRWVAGYGGPRPQWPGSRGGSGSVREALKFVAIQARFAYGKPVRKGSARLRFAALERSGFACVYCGRKPPEVELHVDHVIPVAKGGSNELHNLVAACRDCNLGKHAKELEPVGEPAEA
jgi:hypothetical protein